MGSLEAERPLIPAVDERLPGPGAVATVCKALFDAAGVKTLPLLMTLANVATADRPRRLTIFPIAYLLHPAGLPLDRALRFRMVSALHRPTPNLAIDVTSPFHALLAMLPFDPHLTLRTFRVNAALLPVHPDLPLRALGPHTNSF